MAASITERKPKGKKSLKRDSQNEVKYFTFFNVAPVAYQSLDKDGLILEVNETWLNTMQYTKDEVIG